MFFVIFYGVLMLAALTIAALVPILIGGTVSYVVAALMLVTAVGFVFLLLVAIRTVRQERRLRK